MRKLKILAFSLFVIMCLSASGSWSVEDSPGAYTDLERIIVIDPGHGGDDTGVKGSTGPAEKDLTLALAGRLKEKLAVNLGTKVILTRSGDYEVTYLERASIANHNKAVLFVSLHLGFSALQPADNFTAFYVEPRLSEKSSGSSENDFWRSWNRQSLPHMKASRKLSRIVQLGLSTWLAREVVKPVGGDWLVLKGVGCPSTMVELGCLSNPERERSYREKEFIDELSSVLFNAIQDFLGSEDE